VRKYEKEVQQAYLDNEKAVLKKLEEHYQDALDEINSKIELLMARQDADMSHVIYQVQYQQSLKKQVKAILETLHSNEFQTVSEYLTKSYDEGFLGAMYSLQKQGIPLVFPIDQRQVIAAVQHETKLSQNLYTTLGKDITDLQKKIAGEITRGIAGGQMYSEIARNVSNWARIPRNNAMRIARTEAHRIQSKATADAQFKAKEKGADVVKQWDSSLDKRTRKSHRELDGQIRELEEPFEVNGHKAMHPGGFGVAKEDINCRCAILQRARWNLGSDYTKWSADAPIVIDDDGTTQFTIIEAKNYESFKKQYTQATDGFKEYRTIGNIFDLADRKTLKETVEKMPQKVQEAIKNVRVKVDSDRGSGFDVDTGIIHLAKGASEKQIAHEVGHCIEKKLFDKEVVDSFKRNITDGLGKADVKKVRATDSQGNVAEIFIIKSDRFINGYQSRIYSDTFSGCFDADGNIDIDKMDEFVSVAFQYYITNAKTMKKHFPDMYNMVRKVVDK